MVDVWQVMKQYEEKDRRVYIKFKRINNSRFYRAHISIY